MGSPITPTPPIIELGSWYKLTVNEYFSVGLLGCAGTLVGSWTCCKSGLDLKQWLDAGSECVDFEPICSIDIERANEITDIVGPYASQTDCVHAL